MGPGWGACRGGAVYWWRQGARGSGRGGVDRASGGGRGGVLVGYMGSYLPVSNKYSH